jgi:hypothetical protein
VTLRAARFPLKSQKYKLSLAILSNMGNVRAAGAGRFKADLANFAGG